MPPIKGENRVLTPADKKVIDELSAAYPRQQASLFRILWLIQDHFGYVFPAALGRAAAYCRVSPTRAYGAMSFYAYFRTKPLAEHVVAFCSGPTCHLRGIGRLEHALREGVGIHQGISSPAGTVSVTEFECHGSCHLAPYFYVDGRAVTRATPADVERIVAEFRTNGQATTHAGPPATDRQP
jgi:NADH:ubiquinone oxidoreductase subunit E